VVLLEVKYYLDSSITSAASYMKHRLSEAIRVFTCCCFYFIRKTSSDRSIKIISQMVQPNPDYGDWFGSSARLSGFDFVASKYLRLVSSAPGWTVDSD